MAYTAYLSFQVAPASSTSSSEIDEAESVPDGSSLMAALTGMLMGNIPSSTHGNPILFMASPPQLKKLIRTVCIPGRYSGLSINSLLYRVSRQNVQPFVNYGRLYKMHANLTRSCSSYSKPQAR